MLGYRAAIMRAHPGVEVGQWVVVLGEGTVGSIDHGGFRLGCRVLYLRDVPVEDLLAEPALAPLAALGRGSDEERADAHLRALRLIAEHAGDRTSELLETASVLATIRLRAPTIQKIRTEAGMTVESIADFYAQTEGGQFLIDKGREQGREQAREEAVAVLLRERFGDDPRIPGVARRLAAGDLATAYRSVLAAGALDDLADDVADDVADAGPHQAADV